MVVTFASLTLWGCATVPAKNYQFENSRAYSNKTGGVSKSMLTLNEAIIDVKKG